MKISAGLFDKSVVQRTKRGVCDILFSGICGATGKLVLDAQDGKAGHGAICSGTADGKKFSGRLKGLKTGGPYSLKIAIVDRAGTTLESQTITDVFVGDVWILGGQSNMQGCGLLKDVPESDLSVRAFYMNDEWDVARDPLHNLCDAMDPVHGGRMDGKRTVAANPYGAGPGVSFGLEMFKLSGVPQGLIACAHGGTSMSQWAPSLKSKGGASLYGAMLRRFHKTGGKVAGVAWYQGCSDANEKDSSLYTRRMKELVRSMRRDFNDKSLPFVAVQIGRYIRMSDPKSWIAVQDHQRKLPDLIPNCLVVPAIDLDLDDAIHIAGTAQQTLGKRMARAMGALTGIKKAGKPPIALDKATVVQDTVRNTGKVVVFFKNVVGKLSSKDRASGFTLGNPAPVPGIIKIETEKNAVILYTDMSETAVAGCFLSYGYGPDPLCNITDSDGRPLPVFGPVPLGMPVIDTPFVEKMRISPALPLEGGIKSVGYPGKKDKTEFKPITSGPSFFFDLHNTLFKPNDRDLMVFFLCEIECMEKMKVKIGVAYDGPLKMWVNGKNAFCDPNGCNPAGVDKACVPVTFGKGRNEIMLALSSNMGRAWGVKLRMSRQGVSWRKLIQSGNSSVLPKIIG